MCGCGAVAHGLVVVDGLRAIGECLDLMVSKISSILNTVVVVSGVFPFGTC